VAFLVVVPGASAAAALVVPDRDNDVPDDHSCSVAPSGRPSGPIRRNEKRHDKIQMERLVATASGTRRFLTGRRLLVAILVLGMIALAGWLFLGGFTLRNEVSVVEAELHSSDRLALVADSCNGDCEVSQLRETGEDAQVEVVASSPFLGGGEDCFDVVEVQLREPLGDRAVIDLHTGESVSVSRLDSVPG
jgi:hypothetical protein